MSEATPVTVGDTLRQAREAQGLSRDEAAVRLRLMHRQIEAMETGDFESLGQPVFARGFVRNYARLLGLSPEPLLAGMGGATNEPVAVHREAPMPPGSWLTSPWLLLLLAGALLLAMVPVVLYWWLNSEESEEMSPPVAVSDVRPRPVADAPAVATEAVQATTAESVVGADGSPLDEGAPAVVGAVDVPPVMKTDPQAASMPSVRGALQLEFGAESWVEIRDATGRMLHRQLNVPGSSIEVRGEPPFDLVVGNAGQVRMTYNGRPIDLKPFIDVTVARFTLEE